MKAKDMILISIFASLTAIGAFIRIDIGYIPFTLQFFFCALSGVLLGAKMGALSQIIYVAIGLLGLPVFSKGGGLSYVFKPSFGFIIGFIAAAYIIGLFSKKSNSFITMFFSQILGLTVLYIFGVIYMYLSMNFFLEKPMAFINIIKAAVLPFIIADIIKIVLVSIIGVKIKPILRNISLI
ncbi:biotin transport system substrate-specific component [Caloramator quimbayensis]|uniref:Biotin transporter n=1 Tax=Caloramator quimbayensis TaxID=1147123 RepID=A0A1T4Y361_9CLOT|nr:biotin transporter BioY [Caloramator quimbayensis]SKA95715.1 biotin transport system substrate-specific component [Caloramator quimbayensis]